MWLTEFDLELEKGALSVQIERPLVEPWEHLSIRSEQGGLYAGSLGNANPRTLEVDHRMGGMFVGLGGEWMRDASIRVRQSMGGGDLRLPDEVEIRGLELDRPILPPARSPEAPPPRVIRRPTSTSPVTNSWPICW